MNIIYREFKENDTLALSTLLEELGYEIDGNTLRGRVNEIRDVGGEVIVAELNGEVVGCINAIIDIRLAEGKSGEVVSLVVSNMHRGFGIGKGLVQSAESWLSNRCEKIRVRANIVRSEAHDFYKSIGYHELKSQKIFTKRCNKNI